MANHTFLPALALDRGSVRLHGHVAIGATGAITSYDCNGFTPSRTGTGAYTLTLDAVYPQSPANYVSAGTLTSPLLFVGVTILDAGTRSFLQMSIVSQTVHTDGKINIVFDSSANTPADPNNGCTLRFVIDLKNSNTPRKGS
jgi:hypothetical protein